jgi:hypothetical protein
VPEVAGKNWEPFSDFLLLQGKAGCLLKQNTIKLKERAMKMTLKLISPKLFLTLLAAWGASAVAFAQGESATGTVSGVLNGSLYDYTITLNNTSGSVPIGSFWYSWTPTISPFFYLPSTPGSAGAPAGWTAGVVANSIQFSSSGTPLAPGQSIQFTYAASFSPAQLTGDAGYSYVYSGGIEGDAGAFVNIQTVPEPASRGLLTAGLLSLVLAGRRKLQKGAAA